LVVSLGGDFTFSWDKSQCVVDAKGFVLDCDGQGASSVAGVSVQSVSTTLITEKIKSDEYHRRKYRLVLSKEGDTFFMSLQFYQQKCF
jgi:hypothetical protein